jgi:Tfp pilus assembly protein PilV
MVPNSFREETGFTLVEALVAATIVATAIVAIAHLAAIGIRQSATSSRALIALLAAQGKLEHLAGDATPVGSGEEAHDSLVLRWNVTPITSVDPRMVTVEVCAYGWTRSNERPEACVTTLRAPQP